MRIDGEIEVGEAARWAARACARLSARPLLYVLSIGGGLIGVAVGGLAATIAVDTFNAPGWLFPLIMIAVMWPIVIAAIRIVNRTAVGQYRRKLRARGVSGPLGWRIETDDVGFVHSCGGVETRVKWSVVSEVLSVGPYWVLLSQGTPVYVPKRHLQGDDRERVFVADVLRHLTPDSRARSSAAVQFAGPISV